MSLSLDEITSLRMLQPDWPEAWARLSSILIGTLDSPGRLVAAAQALKIAWPGGQIDVDDFVSWILETYGRRAARGTLLASFDPSRAAVEDFLCSRNLLRKKALRFLERRALRFQRGRLKSNDGAAIAAGERPPPAAQELSREFYGHVALIELRLSDLPLQLSARDRKKPTRVAQQAGLQLYPRVDWGKEEYVLLHEHLATVVHSAPASADPYATLVQVHKTASQYWQMRILDVQDRIYNQGRGVSERARERLENRRAKRFFNKNFQPLKVPVLVELLRISPNDAAAQRRRYRQALPKLLAGLRVHHEVLTEQREATRERGAM